MCPVSRQGPGGLISNPSSEFLHLKVEITEGMGDGSIGHPTVTVLVSERCVALGTPSNRIAPTLVIFVKVFVQGNVSILGR